MTLKLAHVSDVHLGAKLVYLGNKADEHRANIKNGFHNSVLEAIKNRADLFIIAGDLFDNSFPSKPLQIFVLEHLKQLVASDAYVLVIPGNHDRKQKGGVWDKSLLTEYKDDHFLLVAEEKQTELTIPSLDLRIITSGVEHQKNKNTPYTPPLKANTDFKFNIGVFHGSADIKGEPDNNPIYLKDLQSSKFDYFALGDWHNFLELGKNTDAWYCGSPELIDSDQEKAGQMLFVTLEDNKKPVVQKIQTGSKFVRNLNIDLAIYKTLEEIVGEIKKYKDKNAVLNLIFKGLKNIDLPLNIDEVLSLLVDDFYYINAKDESVLKISDEDLKNYPESMIIGKYIKTLLDQKKKDDARLNEDIDDAIQLGVSLLKGGDL